MHSCTGPCCWTHFSSCTATFHSFCMSNDHSRPSRPPPQRLEEDQSLQGPQRKALLEDRKKELLTQQKASENEHLQILDTMAKHERVEFQQMLLQDRQGFEKALLQEVCPVFPSRPRNPSLYMSQLYTSHFCGLTTFGVKNSTRYLCVYNIV